MKKKEKIEEAYRIFARKFRPEAFGEVMGQEAVTRLLQSALRTGRIPQSFLFSGPRGIGKTSTARILAKALNCEKGPTDSPCNECNSCSEITKTNALDVLEIDGASNRGIDEIRTLRENVKFKPAEARFKIYIIDEVHMLTGEAFNALLKTLEEPPEHVKFIFATTEPHKVPLTILSRCQRFNFKRIPIETIAAKLGEIAEAEGLKPEPEALYLMARVSDGSLRDAETLLDQLSVLSQGEISEEDVLFTLGLAGEEVYFKLLKALGQKQVGEILSLVRELYESGKDLVQFGRGLLTLFRNLLLLEIGKGAEGFIEAGPEAKKELAQYKDTFSREELLLILSLLQNLQGDFRRALAPPKLLLETALLKLLHLEGLHLVSDLVKGIKGDSPQAGDRLTAEDAPAPMRWDSKAAAKLEVSLPLAPGKPGVSGAAGFFEPPEPEAKEVPVLARSARTGGWAKPGPSTSAVPSGAVPSGDHTKHTKSDCHQNHQNQKTTRPPEAAERGQATGAMSPHSEAVPLRRQSAGDLPAPFGGNSAPAFSLNQVEAVWPRVLEAVKAEEMSTGMFLAEASLVEVSGDQIVAGFPEEFKFHKEMVEKPEKKKMIEEFLGQFLAAEVQIQFVATRIQTESRTESPGGAEAPGTKVPDIVRQAMDIFQNSKIIRMD